MGFNGSGHQFRHQNLGTWNTQPRLCRFKFSAESLAVSSAQRRNKYDLYEESSPVHATRNLIHALYSSSQPPGSEKQLRRDVFRFHILEYLYIPSKVSWRQNLSSNIKFLCFTYSLDLKIESDLIDYF